MDFKNCLIKGQEAELKVLQHIRTKYPYAYVIEGYCKGKDIFIPEVNISVEVKWDMKFEKTGNFLFEALCDGKPSGISTTESQWWAIYDNVNIHSLTLNSIYEAIIRNNIGLIHFTGEFDNDKIPMSGYLVPKNLLGK